METTNNSENPQRRVDDRTPAETINWEAPGAPAVPLAAPNDRASLPIRHVASLLVNADGVSVFATPDAARLPHGHYMLSAGAVLPAAAPAPAQPDPQLMLAAVASALGDHFDAEVGHAMSVARVMKAWQAEAALGDTYKGIAQDSARIERATAPHGSAAPTEAAPKAVTITGTAEARKFVDEWHRKHFPTDRTFSRYIMNDPARSNPLAGDFAWQLANALAAMESQRAAAPVSGGEREQFEAWAGCEHGLTCMQDGNGGYFEPTASFWKGWQARAAVSASQAAPTVEQMDAVFSEMTRIEPNWNGNGASREKAARIAVQAVQNITAPVASQAAPVGGGLPPLKLPKAKMLVGAHLDSLHTLYSTEQVQNIATEYARAAVAAASMPTGELPPLPAGDEAGMFGGACTVYTAEQMRAYGELCRAAAPVEQGQGAAPSEKAGDVELIRVPAHEADSYCRILSILGMEDEGDPVAEVQRLFDAAETPVGAGVVPEGLREFVEAVAGPDFDYIDRETDERCCIGCNQAAKFVGIEEGFKLTHADNCIVLRAQALLHATPTAATAHPVAADDQVPEWSECKRISNIPIVDDALRGFSEDATADNGTCVVIAVLDAFLKSRTTAHGGAQGEQRG